MRGITIEAAKKYSDFSAEQEYVARSRRLLAQDRDTPGRDKIYSFHEPQVECIAKGKVHTRHEFGVKAGFVTASRTQLHGRHRHSGGQPVSQEKAPRPVEMVEEEKCDRTCHRTHQERSRHGQEHACRKHWRQAQCDACRRWLQPAEAHEGTRASLFVPARGGGWIRRIPVGVRTVLAMRCASAQASAVVSLRFAEVGFCMID